MNDVPNSRMDANLLSRLLSRLQELKAENDAGQKQLAMLEARTLELRSTLLRISGAIQVLEELLTADSSRNGARADTAVDVPSGT